MADVELMERSIEKLEARVAALEWALPADSGSHATRAQPVAHAPLPVLPAPAPAPGGPSPARPPRPPLSDLIGGRGLAALGGVATLTGIVMFLALAAAHGWIGPAARVCLAGTGAAALIAAGMLLHHRGGRSAAALAMVGTGVAGLFTTLVVAGEGYRLIGTPVEIAGAMAVGVIAVVLAVRWAGQLLAALGLVGALLSPVLAWHPYHGATIAVLAVATAAALAVLAWRRWTWLALVTPLIGAPQWGLWLLTDHYAATTDVLVVASFTLLGFGGALATQWRAPARAVAPAAVLLLSLNAAIAATVGGVALGSAVPSAAWLTALAAIHAIPALARGQLRARLRPHFCDLSFAIVLALADVAFGLVAGGLVLTIGWAAAAIGLTWLARRHTGDDAPVLALGATGHLGLVLIRVAVMAPPSALAGDDLGLAGLLAVATLIATCLTCAQLAPAGPLQRPWRVTLHVAALVAIAYLTALTVTGPALVVAWAAEAVALAQLGRGGRDELTRWAGVAFLALAAVHVLVLDAAPSALLTGSGRLGSAALAIAAVALAAGRCAFTATDAPRLRDTLGGVAAGAGLYLASIAVVTAFDHSSATIVDVGLGLTVRQQGQVVLSALWSVAGLVALVAGLRLRLPAVRVAALALLLATAAKVFLYDLSTLTSIYRVISVVVLGLLLLAGAAAHHRLGGSVQGGGSSKGCTATAR